MASLQLNKTSELNDPHNSASDRMSPPQAETRSASWLKWIVFAILPAVLLLTLVELGLRIGGFRFSAEYIQQPIFEFDASSGMLRTAAMFADSEPYGFPFCFEQTFAPVKRSGTLRVAMVGESSVFRLGNAETMRKLLTDQLDRPVEILNFAFQGCDSERMLLSARESLAYDLDVLMVYMGHNEFVSFSNPNTMIAEVDASGAIDVAMHARTVQLAAKLLYAWRPPTRARLEGKQRLYDSSDKEDFYERFQSNLRQVIAAAQEAGVMVVVGTVAYNYAVPPVHADAGRRPDELRLLTDQELARLSDQHPEDANLEFEQGQRAMARGDREAAKTWLDAAFRHDARPYRADTRINDVIRQVAQDTSVPIADVVQAVHEANPTALPGSDYFSDHCHLNARGNEILMRTFAEVIVEAVRTRKRTASD